MHLVKKTKKTRQDGNKSMNPQNVVMTDLDF